VASPVRLLHNAAYNMCLLEEGKTATCKGQPGGKFADPVPCFQKTRWEYRCHWVCYRGVYESFDGQLLLLLNASVKTISVEFITIECYIFANYIFYDDRNYLIDYIEIHTSIDLEQYSLLKYSRF